MLIRNTPYPPGYHDIRVSWILVPGTGGRWPVAGIRAPPPPSGIRRPEIRDPGSGLRIRAPGIRGSLIPDPRSPIPDPGSGLEKWGFLLAMCSTGRPRGFSPDPRCRLKRKLCRPASQPWRHVPRPPYKRRGWGHPGTQPDWGWDPISGVLGLWWVARLAALRMELSMVHEESYGSGTASDLVVRCC